MHSHSLPYCLRNKVLKYLLETQLEKKKSGFKKGVVGTGQISQYLRALAALRENPCSVSSTLRTALTPVSGDLMASSTPKSTRYMPGVYMQIKYLNNFLSKGKRLKGDIGIMVNL